jgi:hypothetical protein
MSGLLFIIIIIIIIVLLLLLLLLVQQNPVHFSVALKICVLKDPCFDVFCNY